MRTQIILLLAIITMSFTVNAQIDRSVMPKPGPAPKIKLGKAKRFGLKNGITVIMVENHKLPRVSARLSIDNPLVFEGDIAGISDVMGSLLGRGTPNISKDNFNEKVDYLGARINFSSHGAFASCLTKYFPEVLQLMADGIKNATFTKEEFDKEIKIILDGIKAGEKNIDNIANRVENALTYGKKHPFGEFASKESILKITLEDVKSFYNNYYKPNNAYLIIEGDIDTKKTKKLVTTLFSTWKKGTIPTQNIVTPTNVQNTQINFVDMPNAVQSKIAVINNINLTLKDKDYYAVLLANQILGGGGTARLFQNLREDKAYTYGAYSKVTQNRHAATFKATASVRNMVTDSAVVELMKEITKIRYKKVSAEELTNAKEKYIGNFVMNVQKPKTAANYALNIAKYGLPDNFYANYINNINAVTINDVQDAAIKYFKGNKARIVITGKGIEVLKNLEKTDYNITYFNTKGNSTTKPEMSFPIPKETTAKSVINKYLKAIGGKDKVLQIKTLKSTATATVQETPLVMTVKKAAPNKSLQEISVMGQIFQKSVFNGKTGYSELRGQRKPMPATDLKLEQSKQYIIDDLNYTSGEVLRIEAVNGQKTIVIGHNKSEIYYNMESGLKIKSVTTTKTPDGKDVKVPTIFSNYKKVNGVLFPHTIDIKSGPIDLKFKVQEIKINEGVFTTDFE